MSKKIHTLDVAVLADLVKTQLMIIGRPSDGKLYQTTLDAFAQFVRDQDTEQLVFNTDTFYDVPVGYKLIDATVAPGSDIAAFSIGSTAGGTDFVPSRIITAVDGASFDLPIYARTTAIRVYFTGGNTGSKIVISKKPIKI